MGWRIEFDPAAEKEFSKLDRSTQQSISRYLDRLLMLENPRDRGKGLRGDKSGLWRFCVGKYRIISKLEDHRLVIFVIRIDKRDTVYNG